MTANNLPQGTLLGRALLPGFDHPRIVTVREGQLVDITARGMATVRDIAESGRAAEHVRAAPGRAVGDIAAVMANAGKDDASLPRLLAPIDLQAIKASGVTFVVSLLERVIEEQARGDKSRADALRGEILGLLQELVGRVTGDLRHVPVGRLSGRSLAGWAGGPLIGAADGSNECIQKLPVIDHRILPSSSIRQSTTGGRRNGSGSQAGFGTMAERALKSWDTTTGLAIAKPIRVVSRSGAMIGREASPMSQRSQARKTPCRQAGPSRQQLVLGGTFHERADHFQVASRLSSVHGSSSANQFATQSTLASQSGLVKTNPSSDWHGMNRQLKGERNRFPGRRPGTTTPRPRLRHSRTTGTPRSP